MNQHFKRLVLCLSITPLLASVSACMPTPEPVPPATTTPQASASSESRAPTPEPTPRAMSADEKEAVAGLQWLNGKDAVTDARFELAQAKIKRRKPTLLAFVGRGLSYPGLSQAQLKAVRRKVNDKIVEGSGDMIFGPTHREMRQKLLTYAVTYNQTLAAALQ